MPTRKIGISDPSIASDDTARPEIPTCHLRIGPPPSTDWDSPGSWDAYERDHRQRRALNKHESEQGGSTFEFDKKIP